jgi:hypothetical protein
MSYTNYTIIPVSQTVNLDGVAARNVSMVGIPLTVHAITWDGIRGVGNIEYNVDPETGVLPNPGSFSDPNTYSAQITEAQDIIYASENPVLYYFTQVTLFEGVNWPLGSAYASTSVGWPAPPNTVEVAPPAVPQGQVLYWYDDAWVVSSFDPSLTLPEAKTYLIQTVTQGGASAVNTELGFYSNVQQITAPDISALDTISYPTVTIGEYQTYVDDLVSSATTAINAATTTSDLYSFNPAEIPFEPADPDTATGVISIGRSGSGGFNLNNSYYVSFSSLTIDPSDTYLQAQSSLNSVMYDGGLTPPTTFAATTAFFDSVLPEDWDVNIRRISDDTLVATVNVVSAGANLELSF